MADFVEDLADRLARDVIAASRELGEPFLHEQISKVVGAASPTLQEAFMTSIRIRLAEMRGREHLDRLLAAHRAGQGHAAETRAEPPATAGDAAGDGA